MKRCIAVLLILCLILTAPCALAADEPPEDQGTETAGESLPENGEAEEPSAGAETGEAPEDAEAEPGEPGETPEEPGEGPETPGYIPGQFTDVDETRWYGTEGQGVIRLVWELGLMNGMGNGTFLPEGPLRICEAIKLAAVIRSRALEDGAEFAPDQPWFMPYVEYALEEGILQPDEFAGRMEDPITRGELAHLLAAALPKSELSHINAIFAVPDVISLETEPVEYWRDILVLYRAGVLLGDRGTHAFRPKDGITRAETAAAVVRMALPEERQRLELLPLNGASGALPEAALRRADGTGLSLGYHPWAEFFAFVGEARAEEAADLWISLDLDMSMGYPVYAEEGCRITAVYPDFTVEYLIADRDPQGMYILRLECTGDDLEDSRGNKAGTVLRRLFGAFPETELLRETGDADTVLYTARVGTPEVLYRYTVGWDGRVKSFSMSVSAGT